MVAVHLLDTPTAPLDNEWMESANCKGRTTLFFPPKAERPQARARREAKARRLCMACSVLEECRSYARTNHEYGFWAGESEEDRHLAGFTVSAPIGVRARAAQG
ncbi:MAG TPA: WhiB family transcriptional regulator [Acidimicrobiaceae bacterium]|nr:WhiB family transcriptional regulator [Acidimicrobiaceae bacterium]